MTAAIPLLCVGVWIAFNSSYPEIPGTCLALLWWAFATKPLFTDDEIADLDAWLDQQRRDAD